MWGPVTKIIKKSSIKIKTLKPPKLRECLKKSYKLVRNEKYDRFLRELGVNEIVRAKALSLKPIVRLSKANEEYELTTIYSEKETRKVKFKLREKVYKQRPKGNFAISVFEIKDNRLIENQNIDGKLVTIVREFGINHMTMTMEINKVKCFRHFELTASTHSIGTETSRTGSLLRVAAEPQIVSSLMGMMHKTSLIDKGESEINGEVEEEKEEEVCF